MLFLLAAIVTFIIVLALRKKPVPEPADFQTEPPPQVPRTYPAIPDTPLGFGYKCMWFAVRGTDKNKLASLLKLQNPQPCSWQEGLQSAYDGEVFITTPVDGWTLALGWGLPVAQGEGYDEVKQILLELSREFTEAHYFATHRVTESCIWMKAVNGELSRAFSVVSTDAITLVNEGTPTAFEQQLNLADTLSDEGKDPSYMEREDILWPDEDTVMQVAGNWSVDPSNLEERTDLEPGLGLLGSR